MLPCFDTHLMAVMIRLSGVATFSSRIAVVILRLDGDPGGANRNFWVTSMRTTFPLLSPHASTAVAEGWTLIHICVAMFNTPASASETSHGAQAQWVTHRSPASMVETNSIASPLSVESRYLGGVQVG